MCQYMCASTPSTIVFCRMFFFSQTCRYIVFYGCQDMAIHNDVPQRKVETHTITLVYTKIIDYRY